MINLIVAYTIIAVVLSAYVAGVVWRTRKIERALQQD